MAGARSARLESSEGSAKGRAERRLRGVAVVAVLVALSACLISLRARCGVRGRLAAAGLGRLPSSATSVISFGHDGLAIHVDYVKFEAEPADIQAFIGESGVTAFYGTEAESGGGPLRWTIHCRWVFEPAWWQPPSPDPNNGPVVYEGRCDHVHDRYCGVLVDYTTGRVYVVSTGPVKSRWIRRIKRLIPFI